MPLLFIVLIFVIWLGYEIKKNTRESKDSSKRFWEREHEALLTPRKDISEINFIMIPENIIPDEIPSPETDNAREINDLISSLRKLCGERMADFSAYSNTDLRLKYGSPNFTALSKADETYTTALIVLPKLITALRNEGITDSADILCNFCNENNIHSKVLDRIISQ